MPATTPGGLTEFKVRTTEAAWSVKSPVELTKAQEKGILGTRFRTVWSGAADGVTYTVQAQSISSTVKGRGSVTVLDSVRDALAVQFKGKAGSEKPAKLNNAPAREYWIEAMGEPNVVRARSILVGTRVYELYARGPKDAVSRENVNSFFDSFKIVPLEGFSTMTTPIRVSVTGAGGQIGYALIFRIASGGLFGPDQPVALQLLEITPALPALNGTLMELEDCAFPHLAGVVATDNAETAFADADWVILVGGLPPAQGWDDAAPT